VRGDLRPGVRTSLTVPTPQENIDVPEKEDGADGNLEHPQVDREQRVVAGADALHEEGGLDEVGEEEHVHRHRHLRELGVLEAGICQ
jgi:hypothetical protein